MWLAHLSQHDSGPQTPPIPGAQIPGACGTLLKELCREPRNSGVTSSGNGPSQAGMRLFRKGCGRLPVAQGGKGAQARLGGLPGKGLELNVPGTATWASASLGWDVTGR